VILSLKLAWRNIWRQKRRTWLTAVAIIFSNSLLVFMISLQFGSYDMMINNTLQTLTGHIQVQHPDFNKDQRMRYTLPHVRQLSGTLRHGLGDARVTARGEAFALASSERRSFGIEILGVEPRYERGVSTLPGLISKGRYLNEGASPEIVIGSILARNLKVTAGDDITLLGSDLQGGFAAGIVKIVGIIESGSTEIDRSVAEVPLAWFQDVFAMGDKGHAIVIRCRDLESIQATIARIRGLLKKNFAWSILDWEALQPGLKQAIQADLSSGWFMYAVLIILVSFSVLNTMLMSVLERTREFGVLMALGIRPAKLASLVMFETSLIASLGLLIGAALGWMIVLYFHQAGFSYPGMDEMAKRFNLPPRMYPSITAFSVLLGPGVVFVSSLMAAVYPALRLFRLQPVAAMRAA